MGTSGGRSRGNRNDLKPAGSPVYDGQKVGVTVGRRKRSDQVDVKVREPPGRDRDVERNSPDMMLNFPLFQP